MRTGSVLAVVSAMGVLTGCASALQTQPASCPPGQVARMVHPGTLEGRAETQAESSEVKKTNKSDTAANRLNRSIVGAERQRRNEELATGPRYRCEPANAPSRTGVTSKQAGKEREKEGRPSMQPGTTAEGRPSMQPVAPAGGGVGGVIRDVAEATNPPGPYRPFAIEINPLGLLVGGRLSFNAEWAPVTHHVIVVSPHLVHTTAQVPLSGGQMGNEGYGGIGTEIGYRYYSGTRGMNGIFAGPSLIMGVYNAALPMGSQVFTNIGVAGDVGVQEIFWNHIVAGAGVGLEYLQVSQNFGDLPTGPSTIASSGLKPRFLLEAGYAF